MHTVTLNIHDSVYDRLMGLFEIFPSDKIEVLKTDEYPAISFEEARQRVEEAANNIHKDEGISIDEAFDKIMRS